MYVKVYGLRQMGQNHIILCSLHDITGTFFGWVQCVQLYNVLCYYLLGVMFASLSHMHTHG